MALKIQTFDNVAGGQCLFKALGHPLAVERARSLQSRLGSAGAIAVYDPLGLAEAFDQIYGFVGLPIAGVFVQDLNDIGKQILGQPARPVNELAGCKAAAILVTAFDAERLIEHIRHLVPAEASIESFDALRLSDDMLTNPRRYLDPLNFATNFAFFRDQDGQHTRLVTVNYWSGYGAAKVALWLTLFDADGHAIAQWREAVPAGAAGVTIDSREVRERFGLGPFAGQLFLHVIGAAGHDVVKYALDVYGARPDELSCTHDANAWPADFYAGLPAPRENERVVLWVQNSHPTPIPAGAVGLGIMGTERVGRLDRSLPGFASYPLDVSRLLPEARWPQQIEIHAGRHFVRPRYEVVCADGRRRIAHPNVERSDLKPDPKLPQLANLLGKGYLLPAPVLPPDRFRTIVLPTPMATTQRELPVTLIVYDGSGKELGRQYLGRLPRNHARSLDLASLLDGNEPAAGYGHLELTYDFRDGGEADGWLHALFRYEDKRSGHAAETSFGAHVFNTVLTYRGEPQSYAGRPPGLSTRLFLRLGEPHFDTFCHLIYPASTPWHPRSDTDLILYDRRGAEVARRRVEIACSGSLLWRARDMFGAELDTAGEGGYVVVRDLTCRLFGYHGLADGEQAFSLDHMFGF